MIKNASSHCSQSYLNTVIHLLQEAHLAEQQNIGAAAERMADAIAEDRLIHVFGVGGHSVIGSEEFFYRAGGLACVSPLFDLSLLLAGGGAKSTMLERNPGVGDKIVKAHDLRSGDVLIVTSIYGMNAATIDAALEAKARNVTVIALTSLDHSGKTPRDFPARHPNGKNLSEISDFIIDNHVPHGDSAVNVAGVPTPMGPVSTILVSFCVQWLIMETATKLVQRGLPVPAWRSANVPGGDEYNAAMMEKYLPRIRAL